MISVTSPQDNYKTVRDLVDIFGHIYPVGRLDVDSEGLVLLNHDGEITNPLITEINTAVLAADLSLGKDEFGMRWIKAYRKRQK